MCRVHVQVVQEMKLEDLEKLRAEEDPWLIAFFNGMPLSPDLNL